MVHYQSIWFEGGGARVVYLKKLLLSRIAYIASMVDVTMEH
jgi:hypothetical protein